MSVWIVLLETATPTAGTITARATASTTSASSPPLGQVIIGAGLAVVVCLLVVTRLLRS